MPQPVVHVLGLAAADCRQTDVALASEAIGQALDAELNALDTVTSGAALKALGHRVGAAAGHECSCGSYHARIRAWEQAAYRRIQARATTLFPGPEDAAWVADLHPPVGP